ncbi:hypothetical protein JW823_09220 [bacterium]|nr:hypothetical protein [candidate division CSSED10-310 bacterium]
MIPFCDCMKQDLIDHFRRPECPTFTLIHSRQPIATCTGAPWIRLTKRVLSLHDPEREILITSAGMLHYDIVLREWMNRGGFSHVVVPGHPDTWLKIMDMEYRWLMDHPGICLSGTVPSDGLSPDSGKLSPLQRRDEMVLDKAHLIEVGCISRSGRMCELLKRKRKQGAAIRVRRLLKVETESGSVYRDRTTSLPGDDTGYHEYIWHFTRRRTSAWPGESMTDYLDDLLGLRDSAPYTPETVLRRIVTQHCLKAGAHLIRGGHRVVCFTAAPWHVIKTLFTWQSHLRRARFEPFALGIRKTRSRELGIVPVIYGPVSIFNTLSTADRWRFQKHDGHSRDWITEDEWRCHGDLDLKRINSDDLAILTPEKISKLTDWQ